MKFQYNQISRMPHRTLFLFLAFLTLWSPGAFAAETLPPRTEAKIRTILDSPRLKDAYIGLSILDLGTVKNASTFPARPPVGKPFRAVFEYNSQKKFLPASNMKLFTAAIALQLLGKEKSFPTRVFYRDGQLVLYGGGDPALKVADLKKLADQIGASGVSEIREVIGDGSAFTAETDGGRFPFGWTVDDTRWYYGPEIGALAIERNHFDLIVTGGAGPASPAKAALSSPIASVFGMGANVVTGAPEIKNRSEEEILDFRWGASSRFYPSVDGKLVNMNNSGAPVFSVWGQVAPTQKVSMGVAFPAPAQVAALALQKALHLPERLAAPDSLAGNRKSQSPNGLPMIARHESPPLGVLLQRLLKNSDNLYAEMLLRDAAYYHDGTGGRQAGPRAHALLKTWMISQNIDVSPLRFEDGSGLSRYNLLTPRATSELLAAINRMKDGQAIWNALPIAGVDGTLRTRMRSTPAAGNARAKTGTLSIASNLSGYVTTRDKRRLAVALYVNFARNAQTARWAQDEIFAALAAAG